MNKPVRPNDLYAQDFAAWADAQADALARRDMAALDLDNLAGEIADLGKSERADIASNLRVVLLHLLKWVSQPRKRSRSWQASITEHRTRIEQSIEDSPSLRRYPAEVLAREYARARKLAAIETGLPIETFPDTCPFAIEAILDPDWLPGAP